MAIHVPMYGNEETKEMIGDLRPFARDYKTTEKAKENRELDLFETWDGWNLIRSVCKYNSRLSVGKEPMNIFIQFSS